MASYAERLSERHLLHLQRGKPGSKVFSKLELLKNDYQERALQKKEQKMLLTEQQEHVSQRINGYRTLRLPEEKAWASNWTVAKRTEGVDRAHPLKPVYPHNTSKVHCSLSAHTEGIKHSPPYLRSKSGPSRTDQWQELEKRGMHMESEIRKKKVLLQEKLRRTEETLWRIQKEKEEAERRAREIQDTKMKSRRTKLEEGDRRENGKCSPLSIDPYSKGRVKAGLLSIDQYGEGNGETEKDSPLSIDPYSKGRVKAGLLSIDQYGEGSGKTEKDCPCSIDPYSGGQVKARKDSPLFLDESHQQYGGARATAQPVFQSAPLTDIVDSLNQMRLEQPAVQDSEHPSSEHLDNGNLSHSQGQLLVPCALCGRRFMEHRLQKHQAVCEKMHSSKRKVFDSSKARAKGTDLEQYLLKKGRQLSPAPQVRTNSWRQKHESILRTTGKARVVQDHIARDGRISDLLPRSPGMKSDYVACPKCSRRFAPGAAERHIPKCKTISKPHPAPAHRR